MRFLWIYFEIPYSDGASSMRALLGVQEELSIKVLSTPLIIDIPTAIHEAEKLGKEHGFYFSTQTTFIYPQDDRHGLAWPVKEQADLKACLFSRHIPSNQYPDPGDPLLFGSFDDGSPMFKLIPHQAQQQVMDLNAEAKSMFAYGDMLPVFSLLRNALRLSVFHFSWTHPITAFTLRNLMYAYIGTGNRDNEAEGKYLIEKFCFEFSANQPAAGVWEGSEMFFDHLAECMNRMGHPETADKVKALMK